jgi:putative transposase
MLLSIKTKLKATIVVEDLNVSGLLSNHKLAQVVADCGFSEFKRQLEYKARKFGCEIIVVSRWFPSSKRYVGGCNERYSNRKIC